MNMNLLENFELYAKLESNPPKVQQNRVRFVQIIFRFEFSLAEPNHEKPQKIDFGSKILVFESVKKITQKTFTTIWFNSFFK